MMTRREWLASALLALIGSLTGPANRTHATSPAAKLELGPAQAFSFDRLRDQARQLATQPYQPPVIRHAEALDQIDYDTHRQIHYRPEAALWAERKGPDPVQFFHLASLFKESVKLHVVQNGAAREIFYSSQLFTFDDPTRFATPLPDDLGFAGFRIMEPDQQQGDWLSFLGASYFRSTGELDQYGLSARGIAIDTGLPIPEEFPRFTQFWLEPADDPGNLMVYALLDGPSLSGAYRIEVVRSKGVAMTITAALFTRKAIGRLGIAPLTSMFWFGEAHHKQARTWRPEVHDSDGLALWLGNGERLWRPLINPPLVQTSSFPDRNPKGFGLLQRDRDFEHYQDDLVFYERRPSLWVEMLEPWGEGEVQLVEIPTSSEFNDNIVAYWRPKAPITAGATLIFNYRLHWVAEEPNPPALGRVTAARLIWEEVADAPASAPRPGLLVIDFAGGPLESLAKDAPVQLIASATREGLTSSFVAPLGGTRRWQAFFYIELAGTEPLEIRTGLKLGDRILTETCVYPCFLPHG